MMAETTKKSKSTSSAKKLHKSKNNKEIKQKSPKNKIIKMIICVLVPLAIGGFSALLAGDMSGKFATLNQPILSAPGWLFPVAWTILYILMGIASYFILVSNPKNKVEKGGKITWLIIYGVQLVLNFFWPIIFFAWGMFCFALYWLLALWVLVLALLFIANRHSQITMWCMLPYALWLTFAAYLNLMITLLN